MLTKRDRLTALPSMRAAVSDVWVPKYRRAVQRVLRDHAREIRQDVLDGRDPDLDEITWSLKLEHAQFPMALAMAVEGYKFAEGEFGKSAGIEEMYAKQELNLAEMFASDELLARKMEPAVREWVESRTRSVTGTTLKRVATLTDQLRAENLTVSQLAGELQETLISEARWRANMMARSATIWNYNEGAQQLYADSGVGAKEWLLTEDDMLCEFCEAVAAQAAQIPLNENFAQGGQNIDGTEGGSLALEWDVEHPPLHPNCRCALMPVI